MNVTELDDDARLVLEERRDGDMTYSDAVRAIYSELVAARKTLAALKKLVDEQLAMR